MTQKRDNMVMQTHNDSFENQTARQSRHDSVWGGGSSRIFPWSPKADATRFSGGGGSTRNFPLMGPFYIFSLSKREGARAPPPESATDYMCGTFIFHLLCTTNRINGQFFIINLDVGNIPGKRHRSEICGDVNSRWPI